MSKDATYDSLYDELKVEAATQSGAFTQAQFCG